MKKDGGIIMEENRNFHEQLAELMNGLTDEQKEKVKDCKDAGELVDALGKMGISLPDGLLDAVSGGVQAGIFTTGGSGEFGPKKPEEPPQARPKMWL